MDPGWKAGVFLFASLAARSALGLSGDTAPIKSRIGFQIQERLSRESVLNGHFAHPMSGLLPRPENADGCERRKNAGCQKEQRSASRAIDQHPDNAA